MVDWRTVMSEERYEALNLILKSRPDGQSWFDIIVDMISENCEGEPAYCLIEDHECGDEEECVFSEEKPCTCGLESAGGTSGTLKQCYEWLWPDEEWED